MLSHDFTFICLRMSYAAIAVDSGTVSDSKAFFRVTSKSLNPSSFWFRKTLCAPWRNKTESDFLLINTRNKVGQAAFLNFFKAIAASHATSWSLSYSAFTNGGIALASPFVPSVLAASQRK